MSSDASHCDGPAETRAASNGRHSTEGPPGIPLLVWLIAVAAIAMRAAVAVSTRFTAEDYLITLRYAENLAHGGGFTYNPGERVLGTTAPLYTLALAGAALIGLPATAFGKTLNVLADGALCVVVYLWLRQMRQEKAGVVAAFLIAVSPLHLRWAVSGMETSLATLAGVTAWLLFSRRSYAAACGLLGVLFLLRYDSLLLTAVLIGAVLVRERRVPWPEIALFAALILPWVVWSAWYFGSPVPVTGTAKMTVYGWRAGSHGLPQLAHLAFRLYGTPVYALALGLALLGGWVAWRARLRDLGPPIVWFVLYWVAFLLSRNLLFEWYLVPPLPVYEALIAIGMASVGVWISRRLPRHAFAAGVALGAASTAVWMTLLMLRVCRETQSIEDHLRRPIGEWLAARARPGDRVMLEPIGYIGYYSRLRVLDTVGLVSPEVLRFYGAGNGAPMLGIAMAYRPDWCVLRPGELEHIQERAKAEGVRWEDRYRLVRTFSFTPSPTREPITFYVFRRVADPRK